MTEQLKDRFIKARREAIGREFNRLNDAQRQGVLTTEGPLLLLAGAGSGKTTVLINRIANILKYGKGSDCTYVPDWVSEDDVLFLEKYDGSFIDERAQRLMAVEPAAPWSIIAITFTNKAADELKKRLESMLGSEALDIWASTFHSACSKILRRDIERLGFSRSFTIYDTADSISLIKMVLKDLAMDDKTYPPRSVLAQISRAKDEMQDAKSFIETAEQRGDIRKQRVGAAYAEYSRRSREANALDFDDLMYFTVKLLTEHEDVRSYYQNKFRYVMIDEYQDTNNLQYILASTLAGKWGNICVVGDDDQSIYKFRGATIENILSFEKQYKNARVIKLEQNYRSTGHILDVANAIIQNNLGRKGKELWTNADRGEKVTLYTAMSESDEAQYIASRILEGYSQGENFKDYAVLYRMNAQSNQIEFAMKRNGISYKVVGGFRFFERAEIKDMLSYMAVINNDTDTLRLLRIVNNPPRGIGDRTLKIITGIAVNEEIPAYEVMKTAGERPELIKAAPKLYKFTEMIEKLKKRLNEDEYSLELFYEELLSESGYISMLEAKQTPENLSRIENVKELKTNIIQYVKSSEDPTLAGFLDEIALYTDLDQLDESSDCVTLMTMHSAKGLEFPTVFIAGAEEGIFPGSRAIGDPEEIEEERRLCYVAVTRAKKKLYITGARQRMMMGRTSSNMPSRFIREIPDDCTDAPAVSSTPLGYINEPRKHFDKPVQKFTPSYSIPSPSSQQIDFRKGDMVEHKAFGSGMVISVTQMGGDALLEIAFDGVGTKRLMAKTASKFMKKK